MTDKYFGIKADSYIILAKSKKGPFRELGICLEKIVADKNRAIKESRYEEAARHREKEVDLMKQIDSVGTFIQDEKEGE